MNWVCWCTPVSYTYIRTALGSTEITFLDNLRAFVRKLASPFDHPTQVYQVQFVTACVDLGTVLQGLQQSINLKPFRGSVSM